MKKTRFTQARKARRAKLTDHDILTALAFWMFTSAAYRRTVPVARFVSMRQMKAAGVRLRQVQLTQPEDLSRLIETANFAPGAYPLLKQAWGEG